MKKILLVFLMVSVLFFAVSCSEDDIDDALGGSCDVEGTETCSSDGAQILVCSGYTWQVKKACNLNFGQYCRQTASGSYSCTDSGNGGGNSEGGDADTLPEPDDTDSTDSEHSDTEPAGDTDSTDSEPADDSDSADDGDTQPSDTDTDTDTGTPDNDNTETCTDCDGTGLKITGTITLFHPSALPSSTYSGLGGVQDGTEYFKPCEESVTLGEKSVYGTLTVNLNTKHIATVEEMNALTQITGTESFIQISHSVSGTMGSVTFPKNTTGITMSYFTVLKYTNENNETETETDLFIDDMDLINGNISDDYAVRIRCVGETVPSGVKSVGPYEGDACIFYVLNFATEAEPDRACYHAIGVSNSALVNEGLTFTIQ